MPRVEPNRANRSTNRPLARAETTPFPRLFAIMRALHRPIDARPKEERASPLMSDRPSPPHPPSTEAPSESEPRPVPEAKPAAHAATPAIDAEDAATSNRTMTSNGATTGDGTTTSSAPAAASPAEAETGNASRELATPELPELVPNDDEFSGTPRAVVSVGPGVGGPPGPSAITELDIDHPPATSSTDTVEVRKVTLVTDEGEALESLTHKPSDGYVGFIIDGRYHVESRIAQGGMGVVYRARHRLIDKQVAVKVLRPELADNREITQRFLTEAQAASSIGNEHIVDITDFGELPDGATYIVMEYLEGEALAKRLKEGPELEVDELLGIARQVAEGLQHAHDAGIIHRDLKPDNIFLTPRKDGSFVKILDFGIAKVARSQNEKTRAGRIFGTPHYMSPEQARGEELDNRADIYALGVILYEMLSGRLPFDAENPLGILTQHMYNDPTPLSEVCSMQRVSVDLEAIVTKCLLKEPWRRYGSMRQLDEDLQRVQAGEPALAVEDLKRHGGSPHSLRERMRSEPPRNSGRRLWPWALGMAVVGSLSALVLTRMTDDPIVKLRELLGATTVEKPDLEPPVRATGESATAQPTTAEPPTTPASTSDERKMTMVDLVLSPIDAHVFHGSVDKGQMPIRLRIPLGQRTVFTVQRPGYRSQKVVVDGSKTPLVVQLDPLPGTSPSPPQGTIPTAPRGEGRVVTIIDAGASSPGIPPKSPKTDTEAGAKAETPSSRPPIDALDAGAAPRRKAPPLPPDPIEELEDLEDVLPSDDESDPEFSTDQFDPQ